VLHCLFEQQAIHNQNIFRSQKHNYKINLISNLAAGGIYAIKIVCILRPVTRERRTVVANLIGNFDSVTCVWRSRCNETYWHFGSCYMKMKIQIQLNVLAFWSLLLEGWGKDTTNPVGILGPLHEKGWCRCNEIYWGFGPCCLKIWGLIQRYF